MESITAAFNGGETQKQSCRGVRTDHAKAAQFASVKEARKSGDETKG